MVPIKRSGKVGEILTIWSFGGPVKKPVAVSSTITAGQGDLYRPRYPLG